MSAQKLYPLSGRILKELRAPFPVSTLKWRKGPGGKQLVYIDARDVQKRLDDVCGADWQSRVTHVTQHGVAVEIGILIDGEWRWRSDGAGETSIEGEKGQFSDAFKRAAVAWGLGRYLYSMGLSGPDNIPDWATPEGYERLMTEDRNG